MRDRKSPRDVYQEITDSIVAAIEAGVGDARMPWARTGISNLLPKNCHTGNTYNGINVLALWASAFKGDYPVSIWGTYRQWRELGAQVKKDEKGTLVVFYKTYETEADPEDENDDGRRRAAKQSFVFNCTQVDGFEIPDMPDRPLIQKIDRAEAFFRNTGAKILTGGDRAYYSPLTDHIQMPDERLFEGETELDRANNWNSVKAHEATHWSGAAGRLGRDLKHRFGTEQYAVEELIAELGSAYLMAHLGLSPQPRLDHACYIANWLQVLKSDKKAIFAAAARAQEAVSYLIGLQPLEVADAA